MGKYEFLQKRIKQQKRVVFLFAYLYLKCLSLPSRKNGYKLVDGFESFEHLIQNLFNKRHISQYSNFLPRA